MSEYSACCCGGGGWGPCLAPVDISASGECSWTTQIASPISSGFRKRTSRVDYLDVYWHPNVNNRFWAGKWSYSYEQVLDFWTGDHTEYRYEWTYEVTGTKVESECELPLVPGCGDQSPVGDEWRTRKIIPYLPRTIGWATGIPQGYCNELTYDEGEVLNCDFSTSGVDANGNSWSTVEGLFNASGGFVNGPFFKILENCDAGDPTNIVNIYGCGVDAFWDRSSPFCIIPSFLGYRTTGLSIIERSSIGLPLQVLTNDRAFEPFKLWHNQASGEVVAWNDFTAFDKPLSTCPDDPCIQFGDIKYIDYQCAPDYGPSDAYCGGSSQTTSVDSLSHSMTVST